MRIAFILFVVLAAPMAFGADYSGKVLSPDGKPVKGAVVRGFVLKNAPGTGVGQLDAPATWCDENGAFHLQVDGDPPAMLVASADGYGIGFLTAQQKESDIHLTAGTDVTVTMQDAGGAPIAKLPVYVRVIFSKMGRDGVANALRIPPGYRSPWAGTTDRKGQCVFSGMPQGGGLVLGVEDDRYAQPTLGDQIRLATAPKTEATAQKLELAGEISGKVLGADGNPAAGIDVYAVSTSTGARANAVSGLDGTYTIKQLLPGTYNVLLDLTAAMQQSVTAKAAEAIVVTAGPPKTGVDFSIIEGVILKGTVLAADDATPVSDVQIGVYGPARPRGGVVPQITSTDANGAFSVRVPPGEQRVVVMGNEPAEGFSRPSPDNKTVTIADGAAGSVEFRLPRMLMSPVRGKVVDGDGNPIAGASVYVSADSLPMMNRMSVTTDADGNFQSMPLQRVGRIEIRAKFKDMATPKPVTVPRNSGAMTIHLEKGALAQIVGTVVDGDGKPMAGANVELIIRMQRFSTGQDAGKTDANGNFKIESLWPDLGYFVVASRDGYGRAETGLLRPTAGTATKTTDLKLYKRDATIAGKLVDEDEKPVTGKRIYVDGQKTGYTNLNTDNNGKFTCQVVSGDRLTVYYNLDSNQPYKRQTVKSGDTEIVLRTAPPKVAAPNAAVVAERAKVAAVEQQNAASDSVATATPQVFDPSSGATWGGWWFAGVMLAVGTAITGIATGISAIWKGKGA